MLTSSGQSGYDKFICKLPCFLPVSSQQNKQHQIYITVLLKLNKDDAFSLALKHHKNI